MQRQLADLLPQALQILIVTLDLGLCPLGPCRAHDQTCPLGHLDLACDGLQLFTVSGIGDLAADPTTACGIRHQDAVATGKAEVCGQRSTLVATLFFYNLNQKDLAHLDHFLNFIAPRTLLAGTADLFGRVIVSNRFDAFVLFGRIDRLVLVITLFHQSSGSLGVSIQINNIHRRDLGRRISIRSFAYLIFTSVGRGVNFFGRGLVFADGSFCLWLSASAALGFFVFLGFRLRDCHFFGDQRLAVRDGDLIIIRMDLGKRQKAMTIPAIVDKGSLQRGFDPRDFG